MKFIVPFTLLFAVTCQAQQYLQNFTPSVNVDDKTTGQQIGKTGYNIPIGQNFWTLRQWNNTSNLNPNTFPVGLPWQLANANSRVKFYPMLNGKANVYELSAANIPCSTGNVSEANELDVFLEPDEIPNFQTTIGQMGELNLGIDAATTYSNLQNTCSYNATGYVASFILNTVNVVPQQTIFVQIALGGTSPAPSGLNWCPDYENVTNPNYVNRFCVDDSVTNYGGSYMQGVSGNNYNLDILPRLISLIKSNHTKPAPYQNVSLVNNPNNWIISGFYVGITNYGGTNVTSTWSNPKFNANGGAFCSGTTKTQFVCGAPPTSPNGWINVGGSCFHRPSAVPC